MPYPHSGLEPMFKWTGGKRREVPRLLEHLPSFAAPGGRWAYHEPFAGGASMLFALAHPRSHLVDLDQDVTNFYAVAARGDERMLAMVEAVAALFGKDKRAEQDRQAQAQAYYDLRDLDRTPGLGALADWQRAARFFVVNQLAFSGMRRFNSTGQFNVPFGHYRSFSARVLRSARHQRLLSGCSISRQDYRASLQQADHAGAFVFLDPPYTRVMRSYSAGAAFDDDQHRLLARTLKAMRHACWMLVIDSSPLTEYLYADYVVDRYPVSYGVNIKNRFSPDAEHLVATNYPTVAGSLPRAWVRLSGRSGQGPA